MKSATSINALLLLASFTSACLYTKRDADGDTPEWGYTGLKGPFNWHALSPDFILCATGTNQSPINIDASIQQLPSGVHFNYPKKGDFELINNSNTIQITPLEYGPDFDLAKSQYTALLGGQTFRLQQFHFHTPSEHRLNDESYPLEAHFVHTCPETGKIAVVGVFFDITYKISGEGDFIKKLVPNVISKHFIGKGVYDVKEKGTSAEVKNLPLAKLSKHIAQNPVYHYSGSLTTPPCTEGIAWYVSAKPMELDAHEYQAFKNILKFNARPTQNTPGGPNLLDQGCDALTSDSDSEDEAPEDEAPEDEAPKDEAPKDEAPKDEVPKDEVPKDEAPKDEVPKDEAPKDEAPKDEAPKDEVPKDEAPKDEAPKDEAPKDEVPKDEAPKDEAPKDEAPKDETRTSSH